LLKKCRERGLFNRSLIAGALRSIESQTERLKDFWVMLSSSTDHELEEALESVKHENLVEWDTVSH
jgi:hypothetical protein